VPHAGCRTKSIALRIVAKEDWPALQKSLTTGQQSFVKSQGFEAAPLSAVALTDAAGALASYLVGAPLEAADGFALGSLAARLPAGCYKFEAALADAKQVALGWCLELYKYDPWRPIVVKDVQLVCPEGVDYISVVAEANACFLVRDLVNAPSNVMGPDELERAARRVAKLGGAKVIVISGTRLQKDFPLIHVVGDAATRRPRLIDFTWGNPRHAKVTLVGKGVCFDTGGLDIKSSSNMLLMKKDMGGAANVLGLAQLIMQAKLPVRLRVLIAAVENAIGGEAFRPGDVFKSRKGLTVEIGNTDAEGRLVLADALSLADEEAPELLIDMATLTGAARVALGPDLPPFFTSDDEFAQSLQKISLAQNDPLWRLPLWQPYAQMIETPLADLNNSGAGGFAGAITAALFLRRFVERAKTYAHFDIFAWVPNAKPGRPKGGEAQAIRAIFAYMRARFEK
jgi:leucyl aminopeptidase